MLGVIIALSIHFFSFIISASTNAYDLLEEHAFNLMYQRQINFDGLEASVSVTEEGITEVKEEILSVLPLDRTNLSWLINPTFIENSIFSYPGVRSAKLSRCNLLTINCFNLNITLVEPAFVAEVDTKQSDVNNYGAARREWWLLSQDGEFISPCKQTYNNMPKIQGLYRLGSSPDLIRKVVSRISRGIDALQSGSGMQIEVISIERGGDASVRFQGLSFPVAVTLLDSDLMSLRKIGSRVSQIYALKINELSDIRALDLRFSGQGVIKKYIVEGDGSGTTKS